MLVIVIFVVLDNPFFAMAAQTIQGFWIPGRARLLPSHPAAGSGSREARRASPSRSLAFLSNDDSRNTAEIVPNAFQLPGRVEQFSNLGLHIVANFHD